MAGVAWKDEARRLSAELCKVLRSGETRHERMKTARQIHSMVAKLVDPPMPRQFQPEGPLGDTIRERMYGPV